MPLKIYWTRATALDRLAENESFTGSCRLSPRALSRTNAVRKRIPHICFSCERRTSNELTDVHVRRSGWVIGYRYCSFKCFRK